jgi:hypothetical protein
VVGADDVTASRVEGLGELGVWHPPRVVMLALVRVGVGVRVRARVRVKVITQQSHRSRIAITQQSHSNHTAITRHHAE